MKKLPLWLWGFWLLTASACGLSSYTLKQGQAYTFHNSPDSVLIEFLLRLNKGDFAGSLELYAYDPLEIDHISLDFYQKYMDEDVTRGRTIQSVRVLKVEKTALPEGPYSHMAVVTFEIIYKGDEHRTEDLSLVLKSGQWRITSRGSLI